MPDQQTPVRGSLPPPTRMLTGRSVYRVVWQLHTDVLVGYCWCGAPHESVDPIELWDWLLAHPETHAETRDGGTDDDGGSPAAPIGTPAPDRTLVGA